MTVCDTLSLSLLLNVANSVQLPEVLPTLRSGPVWRLALACSSEEEIERNAAQDSLRPGESVHLFGLGRGGERVAREREK